MSDESTETLKKTIAALRQDIVNLMADNYAAAELHAAEAARLRALIKQAEESASDRDRSPVCPWCDTGPNPHASDCPAFTPEGEVK